MSDRYDEDHDSVAGSSLEAEFEASFTGEEQVANMLKITSDAFTRRTEKIKVSQIGVSEPKKEARMSTIIGLTNSVKELGVVTPIHVMTLEDEDDDFKYMIIDGLRRMFAAKKNGQEEIDAVVWDFHDKEKGMDIALALSLILNRTQKHTWKEIWDVYRILELQSEITPGKLEYLLQLESGDAMKLKDVMLCNYEEVKEALLSDEKTLDACYKMLQKLRKEEDKLAMEDATGITDTIEDSEDIAGNNLEAENGQLSDEAVLKLLEMSEDLDNMDVDSEDFDNMNNSAFGDDQQKVGERHPIDPALRQAVLARDDFTCACCGMKMIGSRLGLIAVHHKIPVHCSGKDTLDNLITLCLNDHVNLHIMERNGGSIMMSERDWFEMSAKDEDGNILCRKKDTGEIINTCKTLADAEREGATPVLTNEQLSMKKALKLARIAIQADKLKGLSKQQVQELTKDAIKHPMPGAGMKENQILYSTVNSNGV